MANPFGLLAGIGNILDASDAASLKHAQDASVGTAGKAAQILFSLNTQTGQATPIGATGGGGGSPSLPPLASPGGPAPAAPPSTVPPPLPGGGSPTGGGMTVPQVLSQPNPQMPVGTPPASPAQPSGQLSLRSIIAAVKQSKPNISPEELWFTLNQYQPMLNAQDKQIAEQLKRQIQVSGLEEKERHDRAVEGNMGGGGRGQLAYFYNQARQGVFGDQYTDPKAAAKFAAEITRSQGPGMAFDPETGDVLVIPGADTSTSTMAKAKETGSAMGKQTATMFANAEQALQKTETINNSLDSAIATATKIAQQYPGDSAKTIQAMAMSGKYPLSPKAFKDLNDQLGSIKQDTSGVALESLRGFIQGTGQVRSPELKMIENLLAYNPEISMTQNVANFKKAKAMMNVIADQGLRALDAAKSGQIQRPSSTPPPLPAKTVDWNDLPE